MKGVSQTVSIVVAFVVAVAVLAAALYAYGQLQSLTAPSSSSSSSSSSGPSKVILPYDNSTKTVFITLVSLSSASSQFNFNGTGFGSLIIYVPAGWNLSITYINQESLPHNLNLVQNSTSIPQSGDIAEDGKILLYIGTTSSTYQLNGISGGARASGSYQNIAAGDYWLACGITGHAASGMWVDVIASSSVTQPYEIVSSS
jgi:sulfocyanin